MASGKKANTGTVLILVLWALGLLTVFAVHIGLRVQQKIHLLSRLEKRAQLHLVAAAGIRRAQSVFYTDLKINGSSNLPEKKVIRFNNPAQFLDKKIGKGTYEVSYGHYPDEADSFEKRYGFVDEERKINVNKTDSPVLKQIIEDVTGINEEEADDLAKAIFDWREFGRSEIVEFYSDEYYMNLEFPYEEKKGDFETLDELLLVKGMNEDIYRRLLDFVTVYGEGQVNINNATAPVLSALGFDRELIEKVFLARRGVDKIEATEDDFVFEDVHNISADMSRFVKLDTKEIILLNQLGQQGKIGTQSFYFKIQSQGHLSDFDESRAITCVFHADDAKIIYWRER